MKPFRFLKPVTPSQERLLEIENYANSICFVFHMEENFAWQGTIHTKDKKIKKLIRNYMVSEFRGSNKLSHHEVDLILHAFKKAMVLKKTDIILVNKPNND